MDRVDKFLVRVNEAGLPVERVARESVGSATVSGLTADEVCRLYWMLKEVRLSYEGEYEGRIFSKKYVMRSDIPPLDRLMGAPVFRDGRCRLDLEHVRVGAMGYELEMRLEDWNNDEGYGVRFGKGRSGHVKLDSKKLEFLGKELYLGLWSEDDEASGSLLNAGLELDFYGV